MMFRVMMFLLRPASRLAVLAALSSLTACASFLPGGGGPPVTLYGLQTPAGFAASDAGAADWQMMVEEPVAERALDTDRIAIYTGGNAIQYFPAARWSDRAPRVVQDLMVESFEEAGYRLNAGRQTAGVRPDRVLVTELRGFEARMPETGNDAGAAPDAVFRLSARLISLDGRRILGARSFEAREAAASDGVADVVRALDAASQAAMRELVAWAVMTAGAER